MFRVSTTAHAAGLPLPPQRDRERKSSEWSGFPFRHRVDTLPEPSNPGKLVCGKSFWFKATRQQNGKRGRSFQSPFFFNQGASLPGKVHLLKWGVRETRRDGRVAEGTCLESRHTRKGIGGSNPSLSAIFLQHCPTTGRLGQRRICTILQVNSKTGVGNKNERNEPPRKRLYLDEYRGFESLPLRRLDQLRS